MSSASETDASIVQQSLHHLAIQNVLLESEVDGLRDALTTKKKRETRGRALDLLQHYEYWGPNMLWTPRSFREAKTRMRLAQQEQEEEEKKKADMRELARANKLYHEKIAEEKREQRVREKKESDKRRAKERAAIDARKAERQRKKEEKDREKATKLSQRGKRKASEVAVPRKRQDRSGAAARSRAVAAARSLTPSVKYNSCGRKIAPRKTFE